MDSYSAIASLKNFGGAMASIQQLEHYQLLGYVPVKYKDEKFLTSEEKTYKKILVGHQKYFLQPPK
mgnify:CR=1 FL=1